MKEKVSKLVMSLVCLATTVFMSGCGEPVPPNRLALLVKTLGERSTTNVAASAELYWARRLPFGASMNPGVRVFMFPLGLQDYSFTSGSSYESPNDDPIEVDCVGGHLKFDVNIQLYIEKDATNIAERLLAFVNDHQLQAYNGEHNMLSRWSAEKLKQFIREPLAQYALNKQAIDIKRSKDEMNRILNASLTARFNKYAITICAAGIVSPISIPDDQKQRMNTIVHQEYANQALERRQKDYMPLTNEITQIELSGLAQCQEEKNRGMLESIKIEAEAAKSRRSMFLDLVGQDNYANLEQMLLLVKGLTNGHTRVVVVPSTVSYINLESRTN